MCVITMTLWCGCDATTPLAHSMISVRGQSSRLRTSQSSPPAQKVRKPLSDFPASASPSTEVGRRVVGVPQGGVAHRHLGVRPGAGRAALADGGRVVVAGRRDERDARGVKAANLVLMATHCLWSGVSQSCTSPLCSTHWRLSCSRCSTSQAMRLSVRRSSAFTSGCVSGMTANEKVVAGSVTAGRGSTVGAAVAVGPAVTEATGGVVVRELCRGVRRAPPDDEGHCGGHGGDGDLASSPPPCAPCPVTPPFSPLE